MKKEISHLCNKENEGYWAPQKSSELLKADTQEAEHRSFVLGNVAKSNMLWESVCVYITHDGVTVRSQRNNMRG